jgi:pimeloyl-ACP methyl ester carboxylesterase
MPKIQVNHITLHYKIFGEGEPLVIVGAFGADHSNYAMMPAVFPQHQVIVFDNRGCGQSDCPDTPYSAEIMADDTYALCCALNLGPCHFFGNSMGGTIVQTLAHKYPEIVRSIILCNSYMKTDIRFALFTQARLSFLQHGCPLEALTKDSLGWIFSSKYLNQAGMVKALIKKMLNHPHPFSEIGYRCQLHTVLEFDSHSWIHKITASTLVLASDNDMIINENHMQDMAQRIPNARYHCFKGPGHLPFIEQPKEFQQVVGQFLNLE